MKNETENLNNIIHHFEVEFLPDKKHVKTRTRCGAPMPTSMKIVNNFRYCTKCLENK